MFSLVARDAFSLRGQELVLRWILSTDPCSCLDHSLPRVRPFSMSFPAAVLHHPSPSHTLAPSIAPTLGKRFLFHYCVSVHRSCLSHQLVGTSSPTCFGRPRRTAFYSVLCSANGPDASLAPLQSFSDRGSTTVVLYRSINDHEYSLHTCLPRSISAHCAFLRCFSVPLLTWKARPAFIVC